MKVLITGAAGQVGMDLLRLLSQQDIELHASDLRDAPNGLSPQEPKWTWHLLDVTDVAAVNAVFDAIRPDVVYHLAGILSARGEQDPALTYEVNQRGSFYVLEACRRIGVQRLIFTSSIAAFGPGLPDVVDEDAPTRPTTMYGITKVATEMLGEYYFQKYGLDFRCLRFPGLISASLPGCGTSDYALYMYVDAVRRGGYEAFCRPDTRIPLMYLDDGVRSLVELANADRARLTRCVYHVTAFSPTAEQIAAAVKRLVPDARLAFAPDPPRQAILDSWPKALDDSLARRDWDWQPKYDLDQMTEVLIPAIQDMLAKYPEALDHDPC